MVLTCTDLSGSPVEKETNLIPPAQPKQPLISRLGDLSLPISWGSSYLATLTVVLGWFLGTLTAFLALFTLMILHGFYTEMNVIITSLLFPGHGGSVVH